MSQTKAQLVSGTTAQDLTVDNINTTSINSGQPSGRKNLIINGAMQVAQRGTSSTAEGYIVDRVEVDYSGTDETPTMSQVDVASGTTPYSLGFRKAFRITNGNQTSANAADRLQIFLKQEAQNIANSGWNFTSSSSFITLQFWVKSSVAQNFYGFLRSRDGTEQRYPFETGSLSADTWTKVTKTIPGNSNITINNDNGEGLQVTIMAFMGTNYTDSGVSLNAWGAYAGGTQTPDQTSTWFTTNDATLEITGVQLEVGSTATDFEHRSFGEELSLCQRYFYMHASGEFDLSNTDRCPIGLGYGYTSTSGFLFITFPTLMRTNPSLHKVVGTDYFNFAYNNNNGYPNDISINRISSQVCELNFHTGSSWDQDSSGMFRTYNTAARVGFSAEL